MNAYKKNYLLLGILLVLSVKLFAGTPQWCVEGAHACNDTPEGACKYWMDIYSVGAKCSKEYQGISASDQYGPSEAKCKLVWSSRAWNACEMITPATAKRMWTCPAGTQQDPVTGVCTKFSLAEDLGKPAADLCAGNPIEINSGNKHQVEDDVQPKGLGAVSFYRVFSGSSGKWNNNYELNLSVISPYSETQNFKNKSSSYGSMADACSLGWAQIRANVTASWAVGATAQLNNNQCQIIKNGVVTRTLPLLPDTPSYVSWTPGGIQLRRADGSTFSFQYSQNGIYVSTNGAYGFVKRLPINYMANPNSVAWIFTDNKNQVEEYSEQQKLLSITSPLGMKQTLSYDPTTGLLVQVQDSTGGKLTFAYTSNLLSSVTTDDNKVTSYTYNASGLVTDVKRPDNTHRLYHYEDSRFPTALTGITDERGVRFATWSYDAQGRAISSEHAGGVEKTLLAFNADGSTTVTNVLNKQTIYRFADIAGARRVTSVEGQPTTNCVGANQNYTYTSQGWVESKTDWKGNKTTYSYNTKGQEISRTEAFGTPVAKTISTEWHATLTLKTKITEPDRETILNYDANGLLLNQKSRSLVAQ